jgi:hypothetical protein
MSTPNFRALCAKLAVELENWMDRTDHRPASSVELFDSARAALAVLPPEPPTEKDLREMFYENDWNYISPETFEDIAHTVLERWGQTM